MGLSKRDKAWNNTTQNNHYEMGAIQDDEACNNPTQSM